ncbi:MAG: biotin--[acetyl-CoA-carboxylase] ligase [Planctomycetaceae bacterium]|nr:biotin--[acetyl-CoA-carboxylase] ligase [Planctomycetaceae bacterium]
MEFLQPDWHEQLESTNATLIQWIAEGQRIPEGYVLATYDQTAGRGRMDRKWVAPAGKNLTFSYVAKMPMDQSTATSIAMAVALAVVDYLESIDIRAQTKWPNDVWVGDRKICGILTETCENRVAPGRSLIVGIGLNVNLSKTDADNIDRPATSILIEINESKRVEDVLDALLLRLAGWLSRWNDGGFESIREQWTSHCLYVNESVAIGDGEQMETGVLEGFGAHGQAKLRRDDGELVEVWAGDLSLRPK